MPSTEDTNLRQANYQSPRHGGLVVVPATHSAGNVATDDSARRREAVIGEEHTAGLQLQLEKRQKKEGNINHVSQFSLTRSVNKHLSYAIQVHKSSGFLPVLQNLDCDGKNRRRKNCATFRVLLEKPEHGEQYFPWFKKEKKTLHLVTHTKPSYKMHITYITLHISEHPFKTTVIF